MLLVIGFVHESAHGLTCKHYGGEVHSMGLMFLYFTPCFYVDVTESWVPPAGCSGWPRSSPEYGSRWCCAVWQSSYG